MITHIYIVTYNHQVHLGLGTGLWQLSLLYKEERESAKVNTQYSKEEQESKKE